MAFNPATALRNWIKNSPWVFMAVAVHVIALSVMAVYQFAKSAPKPDDTPTVVKLAAPQEKPPEDTLPPEVLDRKAIPKNEEAEIVTFEEDVFMPTEPTEDLHLDRGDPESDRKSTRLNSSHVEISYAVFCLKK